MKNEFVAVECRWFSLTYFTYCNNIGIAAGEASLRESNDSHDKSDA